MVKPLIPSLGASGGVMALLGLMMFQYPNTRFTIIFFPFFDFSASIYIISIFIYLN